MVNIIIGILYCVSISPNSVRNDLIFINRANPIYSCEVLEHDIYNYQHHQHTQDTSTFSLKQVSEIKLISTGLIRLYQLYVSPQGPPSCNFTVTCSNFMTQAIRKYGIFHGLLMAGDRLMRCIRGGRKYYSIDPETKRAIDYPVEAYYLGTPKRITRENR